MPIAVSVVVPVYNPGSYLEPLLESLDRQTLPADRFEAIFVDDGSTDGTAERLDAWCAERAHATVVHQENHGWPGQPRNVGIDRARGEYIQFVDQDDWLGDEALQRLYDYATQHSSDVVIGKMVGVKRSVPSALFGSSVPQAVIGRDPIQDSQTPHKMFRRAFLDGIGLRFPEGRRRLEDHVFVTSAYLRAEVVSIYADADIYMHISRADGGNAGFRAYDPVDYYAAVDEVLDIVERWRPEGRDHDVFLGRWLRIELVGRLRSAAVRRLPRAGREAFYREISRVLRTRYADRQLSVGGVWVRIGAILARHCTMDEFYRVDSSLSRIAVHAWTADGAVRVRLFDGDRELPLETSTTAAVGRHLPRRCRDAVLTELGPGVAVIPDSLTLVRGDVSTTMHRGPDGFRADGVRPAVGDRVRIGLRLGHREAIVGDSHRRAPRELATVRGLVPRARRLGRRVLGGRATSWLKRRLGLR